MCTVTVKLTGIPQGSNSGPLHFPALLQASFCSISWIKGCCWRRLPGKGSLLQAQEQLADGGPAGMSGVMLMAEMGNRMDTDDETVSTRLLVIVRSQMSKDAWSHIMHLMMFDIMFRPAWYGQIYLQHACSRWHPGQFQTNNGVYVRRYCQNGICPGLVVTLITTEKTSQDGLIFD